jgi:hypothetical protein
VKLAPGVDRQRSERVWSQTPGLRSVTQTFPDETDEELSSLYLLEVNASEVEAALHQLRHHPEVEYVEGTASRKLIW